MTLLCDGRDVRVSEDEAFLKDNVDLTVFCEHDERLPITHTGDWLMQLMRLQTAYEEVKHGSKLILICSFHWT